MRQDSTSKAGQAGRPRRIYRLLDGVLLLDKPLGLSSNDALAIAKRTLRIKKAGHTGTLDPLASGLLPLCFGEATKFSADLLDAAKTYEATIRLGARTTTGDLEGELIDIRPFSGDRAALEVAVAGFHGDILQIPPMYSALKRDGRPLYEYARAGETVERAARPVTIHQIEILSCRLALEAPALPELTIRVTCSKGTYVRTLAEDIGAALGCGAHLSALRRTAVGALDIADAVALDTLQRLSGKGATDVVTDTTRTVANSGGDVEVDAAAAAARADAALLSWLRPIDTLLSTFAAVRLDAELALRFGQGQRLRLADDFPIERSAVPIDGSHDSASSEAGADDAATMAERVRVYGDGARLLGTARLRDGVLAPERLVMAGAAQ